MKKTWTPADLRKKLAIAKKALEIYGNMDFWQYRGVHEDVSFDGTKTRPLRHRYHRYTSLEVHPIKDGWKYAQEALNKINSVKPEEVEEKKFLDNALKNATIMKDKLKDHLKKEVL